MLSKQVVLFNKSGYDQFIDFLKAYAILFVVVGHSFPPSLWNYCLFYVWGGMQVPIFILIQTFHSYKKGTAPTFKWQSILKRIVFPFIFVQIVLLLFNNLIAFDSICSALKSWIRCGGFGPGSYYFWIYIQVAIILVLIWPLVKKLTRKKITWIFLIFSIGCEVLFSLIDLPDFVYRLLAVRYLFLIPLAIMWIDEGVVLNVKNVVLSIISIAAVLFFRFFNLDLEPFFFNTDWTIHRWICYFYIPILLTYILYLVFQLMKKSQWMSKLIKELAKSSYEIFIVQMLVFEIFPIYRLPFIQSLFIRLPIWMLLVCGMSIIGGIMLNRVMQKFLFEKK